MQIIDVNTWEEFLEQLKGIRDTEVSTGKSVEFLFRGLSNSSWPLATTLERTVLKGTMVADYYKLIDGLKPHIESFTGLKWEIMPWPNIETLLLEWDGWAPGKFPEPEAFGYMVHLRHHGFPSPLLDWTRSPYIAAFFAFRSISKPEEGKVSIYVFSETPEGFKAATSGKPWIRRMGAHVRTHRRHFLQQSDYTMCGVFSKGWSFARHEEAFGRGDIHQDVLWKFNLPWSERLKVMQLLDDYNLNAFSLFESEESLMETLAFRAMERTPSPTPRPTNPTIRID